MSTDARLAAFRAAVLSIDALDLPAFLRQPNSHTNLSNQQWDNILNELDASLSDQSIDTGIQCASPSGERKSQFASKLGLLEPELKSLRENEEIEFYIQFKHELTSSTFPAVSAFLSAASAINTLRSRVDLAELLLQDLKQGLQTSIEYAGCHDKVFAGFNEQPQSSHTLGTSKFVVHHVLPMLVSQFAEKNGTRFPKQLAQMRSVYEKCKASVPDTAASPVLAEDLAKPIFDNSASSNSFSSDRISKLKQDTASTLNSDFSVYSEHETVFEMKKLRLNSSPDTHNEKDGPLKPLSNSALNTRLRSVRSRPSIPQMHAIHSLGYETPYTVHLKKTADAKMAKPQDKSSPPRVKTVDNTCLRAPSFLKPMRPFKSQIPAPTPIVNRRVVDPATAQPVRIVTPSLKPLPRLCESPNPVLVPECSIIETPLTRRGRSPYAPTTSALHVPRTRPRRIQEIVEY